jgi:hypothetical protein
MKYQNRKSEKYIKNYDLEFEIAYKELLSLSKLSSTRRVYDKFMDQIYKYRKNWKFRSIDFVDRDGQTPLHKACQNNKVECVKILMFEKGCNINIFDENGQRPRDLI